jgi:hypothetical protein
VSTVSDLIAPDSLYLNRHRHMNPPLTDIGILPTADLTSTLHAPAWPAPPNVLEIDLFGWLKPLALRCHVQYDVSPMGSVAIPLSIIGAMAGSGFWIQDLDGLSVPAPLNLLFVGATGSMFRQAADDFFRRRGVACAVLRFDQSPTAGP